jgi:hypothetical protein
VIACIHVSLVSALVTGKLSVLRPGRFTPGKRALEALSIGDWVGHVAGPDGLYRDSNLNSLVVQPVASRYTDCTAAAPVEVHAE